MKNTSVSERVRGLLVLGLLFLVADLLLLVLGIREPGIVATAIVADVFWMTGIVTVMGREIWKTSHQSSKLGHRFEGKARRIRASRDQFSRV